MADGYTVHDRADVREKLDDFGIHSVGQIRRAHGSHRHKLAHAHDADLLDLQATGSPDQIAANLDALCTARDALRCQADAVDRLLGEARDLATPMRDGHGPIARAMRAAFHERADDVRGAMRALTDYRDELNLVLTAVQQTVDSYQQSELSATQRLSASGEHGG